MMIRHGCKVGSTKISFFISCSNIIDLYKRKCLSLSKCVPIAWKKQVSSHQTGQQPLHEAKYPFLNWEGGGGGKKRVKCTMYTQVHAQIIKNLTIRLFFLDAENLSDDETSDAFGPLASEIPTMLEDVQSKTTLQKLFILTCFQF